MKRSACAPSPSAASGSTYAFEVREHDDEEDARKEEDRREDDGEQEQPDMWAISQLMPFACDSLDDVFARPADI